MNQYQPMVKPDRDFVSCVSVLRQPVSSVAEELVELNLNSVRINARSGYARPIVSGPPPDSPKHSTVKPQDKGSIQECVCGSAAARGPGHCSQNAVRFHLIQFAAKSNMRRDEMFTILRSQRSRAVAASASPE